MTQEQNNNDKKKKFSTINNTFNVINTQRDKYNA